jgi:choline dehydrogenase-like flavoprotein
VTYFDSNTNEEVFQPADLVILSSYQLNNVHLLLVSGIGKPYDPKTNTGVTGKNYAYQMNGGVTLFFKEETSIPSSVTAPTACVSTTTASTRTTSASWASSAALTGAWAP